MSQVGRDQDIPEDPNYFSRGGTKPYISSSELWWYTLFGFNHFAVNEPLWGVAKILSLGGFGLWWLWDLVFVSSNGDFVQKNGFPTPFHVLGKRLFGQGAISKGPAPFRQQSTYGLWALSTFLAPFGLQALFEQNFPLFLRNIMNLIVMVTVMYVIYSYIFVRGLDDLWAFELLWLMVVGFVFLTYSPMILLPWYNTVMVAFDPELLMKSGIPFTPELDGYANSFKTPVKHVNTQSNAGQVNTKWAIGGTDKQYIANLFTPKTPEEIEKAIAAKTAAVATTDQTSAWNVAYLAIISPWLNSFLEMGAGVLEFFAARYGVPVDKIKDALKNGVGSLDKLASGSASSLAGAGGAGGAGGLGSLASSLGGAGGASGIGSIASSLGGAGGLGSLATGVAGAGGLGKAADLAKGSQKGGGRDDEPLSTESLVLGGTVIAILGAGAFKLAVDYMIPN